MGKLNVFISHRWDYSDDYALNKNKKIVAVDTGTTSSVASFWAEHAITVVSCRKDSIENVIG